MDPVFRKHWPIRLLLVQTMLMERCPWPRSDLSSPWPVASLQVPLLEFLPGMGRFMLCLSPVFPCLQYQLYYHQGQRQNDRQREGIKETKRELGVGIQGKGLYNLSLQKINIRDVPVDISVQTRGLRIPHCLSTWSTLHLLILLLKHLLSTTCKAPRLLLERDETGT